MRSNKFPGGGGPNGRWGRGFFGTRRGAKGIPGTPPRERVGSLSIQLPTALLRALGLLGGYLEGVTDRRSEPSSPIPSLSH